jgi:hypothetical protein
MPEARESGRRRWLAYLLALMVCAGVFGLYLRPDMMVMLTEQLWACF